MVMLVISRRRRSPRMEEFGRTAPDVLDDKERKVKRGNAGKKDDDEVKIRRRTRRRGADERGYKRGDGVVVERQVEGGGEVGELREMEDWQGWGIIDMGELGFLVTFSVILVQRVFLQFLESSHTRTFRSLSRKGIETRWELFR